MDHALVRARPREAAPLPGPAGRGPAAPLAAWNRSANFRHFADLSANLLGKSLRSELFGIVCILLFFVDLGESFPMSLQLQKSVSTQLRMGRLQLGNEFLRTQRSRKGERERKTNLAVT